MKTRDKTRLKTKGFTLLELLVAISIFSVLGLGSYQMLQTVSKSHDKVRRSVETYTRTNLAMSILQRDFTQFIPRMVRDAYGEPLQPLQFDQQGYLVEFSRAGWNNPAGRARSEVQRVAYTLDYETEELSRHFWLVLDRAEDAEPISQVLLTGVKDFRVTGFMGEDTDIEAPGFSLDDNAGGAFPLAVEVVFSTEELGDVQRIFQLVDTFVDANVRPGGRSSDQDENSDSLPDSGSSELFDDQTPENPDRPRPQ